METPGPGRHHAHLAHILPSRPERRPQGRPTPGAHAGRCATDRHTFIHGVSVLIYFLKTVLYLLLALIIATIASGSLLALHYIDALNAASDPCAWLRTHADLWLMANISSVIIPVGLWFLIAVAFQSARLNNAFIVGTGLFVGLFSALFIPTAMQPFVPLYYYLIVPVAIVTAYLIYLLSLALFRKAD
jgi:hypothetical protein